MFWRNLRLDRQISELVRPLIWPRESPVSMRGGHKNRFLEMKSTQKLFSKICRYHRVRHCTTRFLCKRQLSTSFYQVLNGFFEIFKLFEVIWWKNQFSTLQSQQTKILTCGFFWKFCNSFSRIVGKFQRLSTVCVAFISISGSFSSLFAANAHIYIH